MFAFVSAFLADVGVDADDDALLALVSPDGESDEGSVVRWFFVVDCCGIRCCLQLTVDKFVKLFRGPILNNLR